MSDDKLWIYGFGFDKIWKNGFGFGLLKSKYF